MPDTTSFRITLEIARSDERRTSRFDVPVPGAASRVLDALLYVREHLDPSLGFRYSCRAGMCGACAVVINGQEALSCQTAIGTLGTTTVRVSPLRALPVLRDLTCDMTPFFDTFRRADAALRPKDATRETLRVMPPGEAHRALIERQNGCITCGACYSAYESSTMRPDDLAPAALNRVLMLSLDERDATGMARLATVANEVATARGDNGVDFDAVCPVNIPLRQGIAKLRDLLATERLVQADRRRQ
jgi:succinate dehydrogenase/fumarate reductase iron-sulfur protein